MKHPMGLNKDSRKRKLWLFVAVALVMVGGSSVQLSRRWFQRERMSFRWDWDWDSRRPVLDNLADCFHCDWGGYFSITEHPNDKEGYVGMTYQRWIVGPFMLQRVDYRRPGTSYD